MDNLTNNNFADRTKYSWKKSEFEEFLNWEKTDSFEDFEPRYYKVIAWVIATDRNAGKRFFGCALGKTPYQKGQVQDEAKNFCWQLDRYLEHKQFCWLGGKMNDPQFVADRDRGCQDGYWLQQKSSSSDGYLYGYSEGVSLKRSEGYTIRGLDTNQPYLFP